MHAKVYSTFLTVNWLLGLLGATFGSAAFALFAFTHGSPLGGVLATTIALTIVVAASRVRFLNEPEIATTGFDRVRVFGGPIVYVCVLRMKNRWSWFCFGSSSKRTVERVFAIEI